MRIEVTRHDNPDPKKALRREVWTFDQNDWAPGLCMRLVYYSKQERESTRHRTWLTTERWPRDANARARTLPQPESIPDDVVAEVKQRLVKSFSVQIGWSQ